jgi:hypothetical protein
MEQPLPARLIDEAAADDTANRTSQLLKRLCQLSPFRIAPAHPPARHGGHDAGCQTAQRRSS